MGVASPLAISKIRMKEGNVLFNDNLLVILLFTKSRSFMFELQLSLI